MKCIKVTGWIDPEDVDIKFLDPDDASGLSEEGLLEYEARLSGAGLEDADFTLVE